MLCAENKQSFPSEQKIYTQAQYEKHLRKGDGDGGNGHPNCEFCRKRFYDSTALFVHLNKDHYSCHLCDKMGIKFKYYSNYKDVETHYRKDHFLCEERACLEKQFIAFANEIDLASHNMTWHPNLQQIKRSIPVNFKLRRNDPPQQTSSSSGRSRNDGVDGGDSSANDGSGGSRYEGGLGGRAVEGEWQVELQPFAAGDPRDPSRNLAPAEGYSLSDAAGGGPVEDFPALMASSTPVGSFYSGVTTNKWVSLGGAKGAKNKKADFPALKSSSSGGAGKKASLSVGDLQSLGIQRGAANRSNVSSINADYAQASQSAASSSSGVGSLSNWVSVKVDKRLVKTKPPKQQTAFAPASSDPSPVVGRATTSSSGKHSDWLASDQESVDLAMALSASVMKTDSARYSPKIITSPDASASSADGWQKVEASPAPHPPAPPSLQSEEAFPGLGGAPKAKLPAPPPPKKTPAVNKNMSELSSMLRAAGVSGVGSAKAAPKLTVVKTKKPSPSIGGSGGGDSVLGLTAIGKKSQDNLSGLDQSTYTAGRSAATAKGYTGWAKIGGAGSGDADFGKAK